MKTPALCALAVLLALATTNAAQALEGPIRIARDLQSVRIGEYDYPLDWADGATLDEVNRKLQSGLKFNKLTTKVTDCDAGFSMPTSTTTHYPGTIYGGVCTLTTEGVAQRALVCHDSMVGDVAVEGARDAVGTMLERRRLIELAVRRCLGT
ncbi:hypothetical protein DDF62_02915 [Caulobacter radicis]|uniref:hypothetical protein n=1 Tax=Caulobacter radicis TaxID=2172650 RepID=UPI000D56A62B|nr:hypothetical protein [Caulobacter radicis]PVM92121.1 hypothetical protein DDF62_02915 [Caulobacter radicis]